jgi:deoxycytidylate deaminase
MFSTREMQYFKVAMWAASTSTFHKTKMGAVVVDSNDILAVGVNTAKTHPLQHKYNAFRGREITSPCMHAEINALTKLPHNYDGKNAVIYVSRVMANGTTGMARPCPGCMRALRDYGIKKVFYCTDAGYAKEQIAIAS